MKCNTCGHKLKQNGQQFCPECGSDLNEKSNTDKPRKKIGGKMIALLSLIALLITSIFIFYFIGKTKFTPENTVVAFEEAVKDKDHKSLRKLMTPYQDLFAIDKENTTAFIEFLHDHPEDFKQLTNQLYQHAEGINSNPLKEDTYGTILLSQSGKKWLLFDDYELLVVPAFIELTTKAEKLDLYINDKKVATSSDEDFKEKFGPFMIGTYEVKVVFENDYVTSEETEELKLLHSNMDTIHHTFGMTVNDVEVTSLFDDYDLYVNGEVTDIPLSNARRQPIGEFPSDGSVLLQVGKEYPWGDVISEEKEITDVHVGFDTVHPLTHEEQISLMEELNKTLEDYFSALSKNDISILDDGASENLQDQLEKQNRKTNRRNSDYTANLREIRYNIENITNPVYDEVLKAYTLTLEAHFLINEPNGHLGWVNFGKDDEKEANKYSRELTVFYDEETEKWILNSTNTGYFFVFDSEAEIFEYDE